MIMKRRHKNTGWRYDIRLPLKWLLLFILIIIVGGPILIGLFFLPETPPEIESTFIWLLFNALWIGIAFAKFLLGCLLTAAVPGVGISIIAIISGLIGALVEHIRYKRYMKKHKKDVDYYG